jgi:Type I phosphodiesterase / nucleotide pyrophosphatase
MCVTRIGAAAPSDGPGRLRLATGLRSAGPRARLAGLAGLAITSQLMVACTAGSPAPAGSQAFGGSPDSGRLAAGEGANATTEAAVPSDALVLMISVDGLNPEALRDLGPSRTPNLHMMMREGVSTLNARTAYEATATLPNHTGMITGRPVAGPAGHRVTFNSDNGGTVHSTADRYVSSAFDVAGDAGFATAMYAGKTKFDFLDRSYDDEHGAADETGDDDGRDKLDHYSRATTNENIPAIARAIRGGMTGLAFVHLADPDAAGHANRYMSDPYLVAVVKVDAYIGELTAAISADPETAERTTVLLTSDHGGSTRSHADETRRANYTVPFIAWGRGVAKGQDAYALNPDRQDPGRGRPDYDEPVQPIRNAEIGNLALDVLGLPPVPGSVLNADQSLDLSASTGP